MYEEIKEALANAGLRIKPLTFEKVYVTIHNSGSFEFFSTEEGAVNACSFWGRPYYLYTPHLVEKYGQRLVDEKASWEKEEQESYVYDILRCLERV